MKCSGDIFIDWLDDAGASTGLVPHGYCNTFVLTESVDSQQRISKARATNGQASGSVPNKKPAKLAMEFDEIKTEILVAGLMGGTAALTQSAATVTEEVVVIKLGKAVKLTGANISAAPGDEFELTNSAGTTTYDEGVDYIVERTVGLITGLVSGSIADAASCKASYKKIAFTGTRITGGAKSNRKARVLLIGKDLETNKDVIVDVDRVPLQPSKDIDLMTTEFIKVELSGEPETLTGKVSPYTVDLRVSA